MQSSQSDAPRIANLFIETLCSDYTPEGRLFVQCSGSERHGRWPAAQ